MVGNEFAETLAIHKERFGKPLSIGIYNTGGTFSCKPNDKGLLSPIQNEKELEEILMDTLGLGIYSKKLLDVKIRHLMAIDSSQMTDENREIIVKAIHPEYTSLDGAIVLHGTDTGPETAKYLSATLPYFNPKELWDTGTNKFNWCKPVILLSSQIPAVMGYSNRVLNKADSDAPMNLSVALMLIGDGKVGESGILTNNLEAIRGSMSTKGAEIDIPPYKCDPGVPVIGTMTAIGLRYNENHFLSKNKEIYSPVAIKGVSEFSDKVEIIRDSSNLNLYELIQKKKIEIGKIESYIPRIILYETKGAGNVRNEDYPILKECEKMGIKVFRVPIPGGRIPPKQMYDVDGHEIPALNMDAVTAKYKAMATLSLEKEINPKNKTKNDKGFIEYMMDKPWGYEFLPQR
jgi:L-asparaginase/Glu-tRNA(Gln) amidotransferase subunit D